MDDITTLVNALICQDGKFPLLYNTKYHDYTFPGGKQEQKDNGLVDSMEGTLHREVLEEIGVFGWYVNLVGEYPFQAGDRRFLRHVYEFVITKGEPVIIEDDVFGEIKLATLEEALALPLAPGIRASIVDYQNRLRPIEELLNTSPEDISLEEAERMLRVVEQAFQAFYRRHFHYSGRIGEEPLREVVCYLAALNHLTMANSVQEQRLHPDDYEGTLHRQIGLLTIEIMELFSTFEKTGIKFYKGVDGEW